MLFFIGWIRGGGSLGGPLEYPVLSVAAFQGLGASQLQLQHQAEDPATHGSFPSGAPGVFEACLRGPEPPAGASPRHRHLVPAGKRIFENVSIRDKLQRREGLRSATCT